VLCLPGKINHLWRGNKLPQFSSNLRTLTSVIRKLCSTGEFVENG